MSYALGGKVQSTDLNSFTTTFNALWSTGSGNSGYGQTALASVSYGEKVRANDYWRALVENIIKEANHQGSSYLSMTPTPTTAGKIQFLSNISSNLTTVANNKLNAASSGSTSTTTLTSIETWNESLVMTFTVTFASNNAARYFFNAGGQIGFNFSHPNTGSINTLISDICAEAGTLWVSSPTSGTASISGTAYNGVTKVGGVSSVRQTVNTNYGFYAFNSTSTEIFKQTGDAGSYSYYLSSFLQIKASTDNLGAVTFVCIFDEVPDGITVATGTIGSMIIRPPSAIYLSNTWGTPTISTNIVYNTAVIETIGVNQTWQDVTGSRNFGTVYTNNTGLPIQVSVGASTTGSGGGVNLTVNGQSLSTTFSYSSSVTGSSSTAVVPEGATYSASAYGGATYSSWAELRGATVTGPIIGLGVNQSWQLLTPSRTFGTTYTNTTGKPIQVIVAISTTSSAGGVGLVVNGVTLPATIAYSPSVTASSPAYIIPAGSTYSSVLFGSGSYAAWYELRGSTVSGENIGIGYEQTWQDVTGSRNFGTAYTNDTGRPIQVIFNASTFSSGGGVYLTVNGVTLPPTFTYSSTMGTVSAAAIVPTGGTYSASAYGSVTYVSCLELRITQFFTTSGTFTVPDGITSVTVVAAGGGGGGGGGSSRWFGIFAGGGAGGRGELRSTTISVTPGQTITCEVGTGGSQGGARDGPYSPGSNGSAGGTSRASLDGGSTWFVVANGGQGGPVANALTSNPGGAGGSGGTGTVVVASAAGGNGVNERIDKYSYSIAGGAGAAGITNFSGSLGSNGVGGIGDAGINPYTLAVSGTGYGAGGSGGGVNYGSNSVYYAGTDGRGGFIYIGY